MVIIKVWERGYLVFGWDWLRVVCAMIILKVGRRFSGSIRFPARRCRVLGWGLGRFWVGNWAGDVGMSVGRGYGGSDEGNINSLI